MSLHPEMTELSYYLLSSEILNNHYPQIGSEELQRLQLQTAY